MMRFPEVRKQQRYLDKKNPWKVRGLTKVWVAAWDNTVSGGKAANFIIDDLRVNLSMGTGCFKT